MLPFLSDNVKITKVADQATAATSTVTSAAVDMAANGGWDGVMFLTSYGTAAADNLIKAQQSSDDGSADAYADIAGSEINGGASDEDQVLDIFQPQERYVKCLAQRGTSSTSGDIWAIQYRGRSLPVTNTVSGTIVVQQLNRPAEGTA